MSDEPERLDPERWAARMREMSRAREDETIGDPFWEPADPAVLAEARRSRWERAIPPRLVTASVDDLSEPPRAAVEDWFAQLAAADSSASLARNLVLFGPVGTGKTYAAAAAARLCVDSGSSLEFWPVVRLLDRLRPGHDEPDPYRPAVRADLLILDDLGAERATEWTAERLYALVNDRWLENLPTIVTTNMPPDKLTTAIGDRLASRLLGGAVVARLSGPDRRMT